MNASPVAEYRLDAWDDAARDALRDALDGAGIPVEWRGSSATVPEASRHAVDGVVSSLTVTAPEPRPDTIPAPAGWYLDPHGAAPWRWWDGEHWTDAPVAPYEERGWFPPRADRTHGIRGGLLALGGFVVAELASIGAALAAVALGAGKHSVLVLCAGVGGLWAGLFGTCLLAVHRHGSGHLRDLGLARPRWTDVGIGAVSGWLGRLGAACVTLAAVLVFPEESLRSTGSGGFDVTAGVLPAVAFALVVCVGAPFFEELFFRGLVQGVLTRRCGARTALVGQAVAFGLVHYRLGMTVELFVTTWATIGVAGLLLGSVRWHSDRLAPGMVAHACFNAIAVAALFALT